MQKPAGYLFPILIASLISLGTILVLTIQPTRVWVGWRPATCLKTGCFCEVSQRFSPIRQPANTFSSLGFVFSGVIIFFQERRERLTRRLPHPYSVIMGASTLTVGLGSAFYHASLTFIGQFFDVFGMFLLAAFMLVYAWERIWNLRFTTTLSLYLVLNLFLSWLQTAIPDTRRYAFAIVLLIALYFEYFHHLKMKPQIETRWLRLGIVLLAAAYGIWLLDTSRLVCFEYSLFQGHAMWHILGAVSVWFLHRYYLSEALY